MRVGDVYYTMTGMDWITITRVGEISVSYVWNYGLNSYRTLERFNKEVNDGRFTLCEVSKVLKILESYDL